MRFYFDVTAAIFASFSVASAAVAQKKPDPQGVVVKRIQVVDELGRGIQSEIRAVNTSDKDTHFAYTDEKGVVEPNKTCDSSARLLPKPKVQIYQPLGKFPYCQSEVKIALRLTNVKFTLHRNADDAFAKGQYPVATMLYTESAWRYAMARDEKTRDAAEINAYKALEAGFGGGGRFVTYDLQQKKDVLTPEAVKFLEVYQKQNKLPVSGKLDVLTTQRMAGSSVFPYIKDAYRENQ